SCCALWSASASRLSNSRRLIRPVSTSWLPWHEGARLNRRPLGTCRKTTTADRRRQILDCDPLTEPIEQHTVLGEMHQLAFAQTPYQRILELVVRHFGEEPQPGAE